MHSVDVYTDSKENLEHQLRSLRDEVARKKQMAKGEKAEKAEKAQKEQRPLEEPKGLKT